MRVIKVVGIAVLLAFGLVSAACKNTSSAGKSTSKTTSIKSATQAKASSHTTSTSPSTTVVGGQKTQANNGVLGGGVPETVAGSSGSQVTPTPAPTAPITTTTQPYGSLVSYSIAGQICDDTAGVPNGATATITYVYSSGRTIQQTVTESTLYGQGYSPSDWMVNQDPSVSYGKSLPGPPIWYGNIFQTQGHDGYANGTANGCDIGNAWPQITSWP